jgi:hypothetical protein
MHKASEVEAEPHETQSPQIIPPRSKAGVRSAGKRIRPAAKTRKTTEPLAFRESPQGRELIWEFDPVLDTFLAETQPLAKKSATTWSKEQEELSQWITDHGEDLPEVLTLWPHVKVHKHSFLRSVQARLHEVRQDPETPAGDLWRLLRRVQVVLTAENCVRPISA